MSDYPKPLDLSQVKVYPLAQRRSLSTLEKILVDPTKPAPPCAAQVQSALDAGGTDNITLILVRCEEADLV